MKVNDRNDIYVFYIHNSCSRKEKKLSGWETSWLCVCVCVCVCVWILNKKLALLLSSVQFGWVAQSCPTLCNPMDWNTPGLPVHHQLPEFTQTHVFESVMPSISSSVVPFSSHLQSFPASGSFQMSQFFTSGIQSIGVSAPASVLPKNIHTWLLEKP